MRMNRALALAVSIIIAISSAAGAADSDKRQAASRGEPVRELVVSARAVEQPLMKYRLLPAEYELKRGNAASILLRLPWEQAAYFSTVVPTFRDYLDLPLTDSKLRDPHDVFAFYHVLKRAAYRQTADWEYPLGEEPAATILLPDVQGSRQIVGDGLSVWIRQRIARGHLEEAREGILVGLAVSRHYSRTPFVITQLVCAHLDSMMLSRLEELLAQPDCPNFYWALTALPKPLVDLRPSIELDQRFLEMSVPGLDSLDHLKTDDQWSGQLHAVIKLLTEIGSQSPGASEVQVGHLAKLARAELAGLIEGGAARVAKMSDSEAALRWLVQTENEQSQKTAALMSLAPPAAIPRLARWQDAIAESRTQSGLSPLFVLERPLGAYLAAHKLQRRIDALRVVEAVRDYAAHHNGELPTSLESIADVPMPDDPFTGRPFHYQTSEGRATLSADGVREGERKGERSVGEIHYQIQIRK
jgi:hypothetical protein